MAALTFKVHYQTTEPVPSWTAWRKWQTGLLTVYTDAARFEPRSGDLVVIRDVTEVSQPSRSQLRREHDISWIVNTWIAVRYDDTGQLRTAWFNDARYRGYGHYLSHKRMRRCLDDLIGSGG